MNKIEKVPYGYKKFVEIHSPIIKEHSYSKSEGYFIQLSNGWVVNESARVIKTRSLKDLNQIIKTAFNKNQLSIYDLEQ